MEEGTKAQAPSFEAVETQTAAWALATPDGGQAVASAMLRRDANSPWGWGFDVTVSQFNSAEGEWRIHAHQMVYDAQNADELAGSIPWGMEGEAHRIDPDVLSDAGLFRNDYAVSVQRPLTAREILETGGLAAAKAALSATPGTTPDSYRSAAEQAVSNLMLAEARRSAAPEQAQQPDRNSVFVVVPAKIGRDKESVRYFDVPQEDGSVKSLAEVTLPFGTKVGEQDASFYRFVVSANQIDAGGRDGARSHSVLLPERNRNTGEPWKVTLTRDFEARDSNGVWQQDKRSITVTSSELRECCKAQYHAYRNRVRQQMAQRESHRPPNARPERVAQQDEGGIDLDAEMQNAREVSDGMGRPQDERNGMRR